METNARGPRIFHAQIDTKLGPNENKNITEKLLQIFKSIDIISLLLQ